MASYEEAQHRCNMPAWCLQGIVVLSTTLLNISRSGGAKSMLLMLLQLCGLLVHLG